MTAHDDASQHRTPTTPHPTFVLVSDTPRVTARDLTLLAKALQADQRAFAAHWGRVPPTVHAAGTVQDAHPGEIVVRIVGPASDPDALAWHTEDADGLVLVEVSADAVLDPGGGVLDGGTTGVSLASAVDHEIKETMVDPNVATWVDRFDGTEVALEACDPVQGDLLPVVVRDADGSMVTVMLSNYVYPEWFDPQAPSGVVVDAMGTAPGPLQLAKGGYMVLRKIGGNLPDTFARSTHIQGVSRMYAGGEDVASDTVIVFDHAVSVAKRASALRRVGQRLDGRHRVHPARMAFRKAGPHERELHTIAAAVHADVQATLRAEAAHAASHGGDHAAPAVPSTLPAPPDPTPAPPDDATRPLAPNEMRMGDGRIMIIPTEALPTRPMGAAAPPAPTPAAAAPATPATPAAPTAPMRMPETGGGITWSDAEKCPRDQFGRLTCTVAHAHK